MAREAVAHLDWDAEQARRVIAAHSARPGAMLPVLHALQEAFGYIHQGAVPLIADGLNVSRAEVRGVISFYHDFRQAPAGRHILKICRAEACQAMGVDRLLSHLAVRHGLQIGETTPDGQLTVEPVYCLGNCALSPAALLDDELIGRFDEARLDAIVRGQDVVVRGEDVVVRGEPEAVAS